MSRTRRLFSRKGASSPQVIHLPDESRSRARPASTHRFEGNKVLKRRLAVLLGVVAVPTLAAPGDFGAIAADAAIDPIDQATANTITPMPFETPGQGFPGSAFYYLADPPAEALVALPSSDPLDLDAGGRAYGEAIDAGPAASPFLVSFGGTDLSRAQRCLTQAVYYEAASESDAGQKAVAQVVLNRVAHPSWPGNVCGVVYQGSQRKTGCQFTFTCDGSLARRPSQTGWARASRVASDALSGSVYAPIGHATHYHTHWVNPYWAKTLDHVGTIGAHRFYRTRGRSGEQRAFTMGYAGSEPDVTRRGAANVVRESGARTAARVASSSAAPVSRTADPAQASGAELTGSAPSNPAMISTGQVKQDYANAGQWKGNAAEVLAAQEAAREAKDSIDQ